MTSHLLGASNHADRKSRKDRVGLVLNGLVSPLTNHLLSWGPSSSIYQSCLPRMGVSGFLHDEKIQRCSSMTFQSLMGAKSDVIHHPDYSSHSFRLSKATRMPCAIRPADTLNTRAETSSPKQRKERLRSGPKNHVLIWGYNSIYRG